MIPEMRPISQRCLLSIAVICVFSWSGQAIPDELKDHDWPQRRVVVAVDNLDASPSDNANARGLGHDIPIRLKAAGYELIEPVGNNNFGAIPSLEEWRKAGADWLVSVHVSSESDFCLVKFQLWSVSQGDILTAHWYHQEAKHWEDGLAAAIADRIVERIMPAGSAPEKP